MQPVDPYQSNSKSNVIWLVSGAVLLAAALGFGYGMGLLGKKGESSNPITQRAAEAPQPITPVQAQAPIPVTPRMDEKIVMPQDIYDWLLHLDGAEKLRRQISLKQMGEITASMTVMQLGGSLDMIQGLLDGDDSVLDEQSPSAGVQLDAEQSRAAWSDLISRFHAYPPPAECIPIANGYTEVLGETSSMMVEVIGALEASQNDPSAELAALYGMRGSSGDRIGAPADLTDGLLADICAKYDTRKWFMISSDFGGGGTLGKGAAVPELPDLGGLGF
jgi:hypothetical protein